MSPAELVALVCCDLGSIVRGRMVLASELAEQLRAGVGWVPANSALTPLGPLAEPNPFGSTGDLRLIPQASTRVRVGDDPRHSALELMLCDIANTDGRPWQCCPRTFCKSALADLREHTGARLLASFEHEFQLLDDDAAPPRAAGSQPPAPPLSSPQRRPAPLPFSLDAQRRAEPFATRVMDALVEADVEPERFFAEFADSQFEIPVAPTEGVAAADRGVVFREVVREVARRGGRRASFVPLLDPEQAGNGVHIHLSLLDERGDPLLYDARAPACLSELGTHFAAGVIRHARALTALCAPSPVSSARLAPHHWSAGAVCLGLANRETLLRIPALVELAPTAPERQLRLEFRGVDAAANPYLALGAIVRAGLAGIRERLPAPPILERDPAGLDAAAARRFGVAGLPTTLEAALDALAQDDVARAWLSPLLYDAYTSLKRAELAACADLDLQERCRRYAGIY